MIKLEFKGREVPLHYVRFPAGETLIRIDFDVDAIDAIYTHQMEQLVIILNYESDQDMIDMLLLVNAIREHKFDVFLALHIPYLPYARQDRVSAPGESLSIRVICDLINSQKFNTVVCYDLHSDVPGALLNNLMHVPLYETASRMINFCPPKTTTVVAPDAGALKKTLKFCQHNGYSEMLRADKHRDVLTGQIKETILLGTKHIGSNDFLIVDDICDGGRTFIELAKVLRPYTEGGIYLFVTHGVFTKGFKELSEHFQGIYTHNLMYRGEEHAEAFVAVI